MSWNGSGPAKPVEPKKKKTWPKMSVCLLALSAIIGVLLFFCLTESDRSDEKGEKSERERKGSVATSGIKEYAKTIAPTTNKSANVKKEMYLGQEVVSHTYKTNSTGRSVREIIVTSDGKKHGRTTVIAKPTFKYGTDQMLADVLFPPKRGQAAPWPEMDARALDKEFARSILDPIVISEDDPEDVRIKKEAVKNARLEMIRLIKEGHSVLDIIRQQHDFNENAKELRLTVTKELYNLRKDGASATDIIEYLQKANQLLEQQGIEPVTETQKKGRR